MIVNTQLAQSKGCDQKDRWETPASILDPLHRRYGFTLYPCCEIHTAKCAKYYTEQDDGPLKDWRGEVVFCNPPYSRGNIYDNPDL